MTKMKIIATLSLAYELLEEVYYLDESNNEYLNNCLEIISKKYTDIYETFGISSSDKAFFVLDAVEEKLKDIVELLILEILTSAIGFYVI